MRRNAAKEIAIGGMLAALAVVIMCLGGMIPASTYICPMFCALLLQLVKKLCGNRIAWAWYGTVAILSLLMGPDKEAAAVFVFFGFYPILKPWFDRRKLKWIWKLLYFNVVILAMYWLLIHLFGMVQLAADFAELGYVMAAVMLVLGNVTFVLLDWVLDGRRRKA